MEAATVSANEDIEKLLRLFMRERFGFALLEEKKGMVSGLVTLSDLVGLYGTGEIDSNLLVRDVASPIFRLSGEKSLRQALVSMFVNRFRRIFVDSERSFISDRSVIGHVFSPSTLGGVLRDSDYGVLDTPIREIGITKAKFISKDAKISDAARLLGSERGQCLVCEKGVVSPWDLIMKPWAANALKIAKLA